MPPRATPPKIALAPRMPPLRILAVKAPNSDLNSNPCLGIMSSVLGCWASNGSTAQGCMVLEDALRECMDAPRGGKPRKNPINHHLQRFHNRLQGPVKKKK